MTALENAPLLDYVDRVEIIHLPERTDRYRELQAELRRIYINIDDPKVDIPDAPRFSDAQGFPSKGVLGSYVSHLNAIQRAHRDGIEVLCVLEDDAIFRHSLSNRDVQAMLCNKLRNSEWDLTFLGHPLSSQLDSHGKGLVRTDILFKWVHCYLVHKRGIARLATYLEEAMSRPAGDPHGGKMYVDGAISLYRKLNPDFVALVSNPSLSVQRGSPSSLADCRFYDRTAIGRAAMKPIRVMRDWVWRFTGWPPPKI